jgi:hypothetical protein
MGDEARNIWHSGCPALLVRGSNSCPSLIHHAIYQPEQDKNEKEKRKKMKLDTHCPRLMHEHFAHMPIGIASSSFSGILFL